MFAIRACECIEKRQIDKRSGEEEEKGEKAERGSTNIWGSSGRATRALIELYKSLILHPHFLHRAPPIDGQPILERSPFRSLMFALFRREVSKFSRPLYLRSNGIFMQGEIKICFAMPVIIPYKSYNTFTYIIFGRSKIESLILRNNSNTCTRVFVRMCFLRSQ